MLDQKPPPMMIFDSYYLSKGARKLLREQKVPDIGAANFGRFNGPRVMLECKKGNTCRGNFTVMNNKETGESCIIHRPINFSLGKKITVSNAFRVAKGKNKHRNYVLLSSNHSKISTVVTFSTGNWVTLSTTSM